MNNINIDIQKSLGEIGIQQDEVVMIHGNAGVAAQFTSIEPSVRLNYLLKEIVNYFVPEGTIVVPTFSYSFTGEGGDFDVNNTPCDARVGQFSEAFRTFPKVVRSENPIFSVAAIGKKSENFRKTNIYDCFGTDTAFDLLFKLRGKIVFLGCVFNSTFAHYLEQKFGVEHRYFKNFSGLVFNNKQAKKVQTRYYVRDLNRDSSPNLILLEKLALKMKCLNKGRIGRFPVSVIKTEDFFNLGLDLLKKNSLAFTEEGVLSSNK